MKIKKFKSKQFLKLHLINIKSHRTRLKKTSFTYLIDTGLDRILVHVKKALKIIFQYHKSEKLILFVGFPYKIERRINNLSRHVSIPYSFNVQGFIPNMDTKLINKNKYLKYTLLRSYDKFLLPKLNIKPDLIILFKHKKISNIIMHSWVTKIPVIIFKSNCELENFFSENYYTIKGNFKNVSTISARNIFFIGLKFLFKDFYLSKS